MKRKYRKIKISAFILLLIIIYIILTLEIVNSSKIAFGVRVDDINLGGRNIARSEEILKEEWNKFNEKEIKLVYQEYNWFVKLSDLGFKLKLKETIKQAYEISHHANILVDIKKQLTALIGLSRIEPVYEIDQQKFNEKTADLLKNIEKPAQNATLIFNQETEKFSLEHSTKGTKIDREKLLSGLNKNVSNLSSEIINLDLIIDQPSILNNETDLASEKAEKILAKQPYHLILEERNWKVDKEILINWIDFGPEKNSDNEILGVFLNQEKVKEHLKTISYEINKPATNAQLKISSSTAIVFVPEKPGFELKIDRTLEEINKNILKDEPNNKINIIADKSFPEIRLYQTNDLGINSLIGQGVSNFYGSSKNRIHNIKIGTAALNGVILKPNEEFSFNRHIDETGPEQGYLQELVIKKNKTVLEYGGGLCQVSTTIFRAAVNSGMKITKRSAHAFPVEYYYPQGFDATVYSPWTDFRFINNTPNHILIYSFTDGYNLYFNFYGTNDGRKVNIKGPYILEKKEDGSMKTVLTQEVHNKQGELIEKQQFYSNYKSPDLYPIETEEKQE